MCVRGILLRTTALAAIVLAASCDKATRPSSFTMSIAPTLSVSQGQNNFSTITIIRSNFDKPLMLSVEGAGNGLSALVTPDSVPGSSSTASLRVSASSIAPPGVITLTIHATGEGVTEQVVTIDVSVAVTGSYSLGVQDADVRIARGGGAITSLLVTRSGGHADSVHLSVTGVPSGMHVTLDPSETVKSFASLLITAGTSTPVGVHTLTIRGTANGLDDRIATIDVRVIAPPPTAPLTVAFCNDGAPSWFAYQNDGYLWKHLALNSNSTATFDATDKVAIAFVFAASGRSQIGIYYATRDEVAAIDQRDCPGPKSVSGSVKAVPTGETADIVMGVAGASASSFSKTFTLDGVQSRPLDLIATRGSVELTDFIPTRFIIRRSLTPATGSTMPVLDFSSTEAVRPDSATLTISGFSSGEAASLNNVLWSATSTFGSVQATQVSSKTAKLYSVPAASLVAGDEHELSITSGPASQESGRQVFSYYATSGNRTETLGPALSAPTTSVVATVPYTRLHGQFAAQTTYNTFARFGFFQAPSGQPSRFVIVGVSSSYLGATPAIWNITVPNFGNPAGFNQQWMLISGETTNYFADAFGGRNALLFGAMPQDGESIRAAYVIKATSTAPMYGAARVVARLRPQYLRR